jgi:recombination DNA repair RAD52 pathway protein
MTEQTQQQITEAKTIEEKIKAVNKLLQDGEPGNISIDNYSGFTGYKPQYIVDAMNAVFHIGEWGFEEVSSEIVSHQTDKGTNSNLAICQVKVWLKGVQFQPVGWGQSRVTKGDIGDAKKGAQTDAIKKALSYFSIGNRAYHGLLKAA